MLVIERQWIAAAARIAMEKVLTAAHSVQAPASAVITVNELPSTFSPADAAAIAMEDLFLLALVVE